jgi:hypothetical protein
MLPDIAATYVYSGIMKMILGYSGSTAAAKSSGLHQYSLTSGGLSTTYVYEQ